MIKTGLRRNQSEAKVGDHVVVFVALGDTPVGTEGIVREMRTGQFEPEAYVDFGDEFIWTPVTQIEVK